MCGDAKAITDFQLDAFDRGDYHKSVEQENLAKLIVDVLYPNDNHYAGKRASSETAVFLYFPQACRQCLKKYKKKTQMMCVKLYEKGSEFKMK